MYKTLHKKQGSVTVQLRFARSSVTFCAKRDTIKNVLPSLCNEFILLIKNTSIVSVIALHELTYTSNSVRANTFLAFEPLIVTAFIYFVITYVLKKLVGILERRLRAHD